jgi:hypothetical protein
MLAPAALLPLLLALARPALAAEPDFAAEWNRYFQNLDWRPPVDHLYRPPPAGPNPRPFFVPRDTAALNPPRAQQLQRLYKPWGDGYLRLPVHRQTFNDTRHRRAGRIRRPSKPTYPSNGATGGTEPNGNSSLAAVPLRRRKRQILPASTAQSSAPGVPEADATNPNRQAGWSRLDDYEGLAYMIPRR